MSDRMVVIETTIQYCPCGHIETQYVPVNGYLKHIDSSRVDAITRHSSECPECEEYRRLRDKLTAMLF